MKKNNRFFDYTCLDLDSIFMKILLDFAWKFQFLALPNPTVASLITYKNNIIGMAVHTKVGTPHAEVLAIKKAFKNLSDDKKLLEELSKIESSEELHNFFIKNHNNKFEKCEIFVTLEPCNHYGKTPPCAMLLKVLKFKRIVIATNDSSLDSNKNYLKNTNIRLNILEQEANDLLFPFLHFNHYNKLRLFKIANRLNGNYKSGFISNEESRIYTHEIRAIADNIIISGKTLRDDNPLLDSRYAKCEKDLNIYIVSKQMKMCNLDKFKIHANKRKIKIIEKEDIKNITGFSIIEGGFNFLKNIQHEIDIILGYISPKILNEDVETKFINYKIDNLRFLKVDELGKGQDKNIRYWATFE